MKILYYAGWSLTRIFSTIPFFIKVRGQEHIPKTGGFILATNHTSYFDPLLAGSWSTREMYFFAKEELFRNKLFGWVITRTNAIPIRRGTIDREGVQRAAKVINEGYGLVVFPEGTRSKTDSFLSPKPGIGMLAIAAKCPIVPAYIHGSNSLWKCLIRKKRMSITYGEPIPAEWVASQPAEKEGYIAVANRVMERIVGVKQEIRESD